ncbi:hypothetical protein JN11_03095 [Mucilaginibacter frigoritolerans]|uniref:Uncharacterized protein n=1 Tax=Mucilaginibacter frigoritolerans TaxID=652788 RepID=A0A562TWV6_9SPHI|nr:hypothetical protein [Mucilaginibacter frigoritolerans]TWI98017.1 hypothetical protein JN11_03095 [Mucilaginibacter frigoritolerans]
MNNKENTTPDNSPARRKFVWSVGILSLFAMVSAAVKTPFLKSKNIKLGNTTVKNKTVKMLTQDGRLVEIDETLLTASRKKVTDAELQNWIKK